MGQGQVFCPSCKQHVFAVVQLAVAGNALDGGSGATSKVRKCSQCRAVLPEDAMPEAAPNTTPETAMPAVAAVIPDQPPPIPARPRVAQIRQRTQRQTAPASPQLSAPPAVSPVLLVPSHDYAAMMRDELAALDEAEEQIRIRRAYLRQMIGMLEGPSESAEDVAAAE